MKGGGQLPPRSVIVVGVLLGVAAAFGLFCGLMCVAEPLIDDYLHETKQIYRLYDFYDRKVGLNETAVYFVGSSVIGDAVHCQEVDEYLSAAGYNISTYNLLMDSDTSLRRSVQLLDIIASHPAMVVMGVTYQSVTDDKWVDETVILVHDRLHINPEAIPLYSEQELSDLSKIPDLKYKQKFLWNSLKSYTPAWKLNGMDYAKDPFVINENDRRLSVTPFEKIALRAENPNTEDMRWLRAVPAEMTRHKQALLYNVATLQNAGIPVILLNMPLHPLFSEKISAESRQNFYNLLNATKASWYDMEFSYDSGYFRDSHHATFAGGSVISKDIADIIIQEVESNAVHYT